MGGDGTLATGGSIGIEAKRAQLNHQRLVSDNKSAIPVMTVFGLGVFSMARRHALVSLRHATPCQRHAGLFLFLFFVCFF